MTERDLEGRSFFITGANTGIGRATALALARRGAALFLAGRSLSRTQPVLDELAAYARTRPRFFALALDDLASVRACAAEFLATGERLDVLINNAGLAGKKGVTRDGFELAFGVNHLGPFLLTELLRPRLAESARNQSRPGRIVNVSSLAHYRATPIDWDALRGKTSHFTGQHEYRISKLCNVLHAKELARQSKGDNVHTYALHPGLVASDIWREVPWPLRSLIKRRMISNEEGATTSLYCAASDRSADETGLYYDASRPVEPSVLARDPALARELYERSRQWVGLV